MSKRRKHKPEPAESKLQPKSKAPDKPRPWVLLVGLTKEATDKYRNWGSWSWFYKNFPEVHGQYHSQEEAVRVAEKLMRECWRREWVYRIVGEEDVEPTLLDMAKEAGKT